MPKSHRLPLGRRQLLQGFAAASILPLAPASLRAQERQTATMAYGSTGYTWSTTFLAEAIDSWKDNGVDLKAVDFPTGRDSMQALLAGSAQFSTATETPLIFAAMRGLRPIIVVDYSRYSRDMKIVVRKDRGIDPQRPASLKGKTIATQVGTSGQYMLARYAEMAGISIKDVTIVDMSPTNMIAATNRGDVDGFSWTREAAITAERQSGDKVTVMTQEGLDRFFRSHELLLTTEAVIKAQPKLVDAAVKALLAAQDYMKGHSNWPELIAKRTGDTPDEVRDGTSSFEFKIEFNDRLLDDLVTEANWAIDSGLMKAPNGDLRKLFRGLIYEGPLKSIRPDLVTITSA
jgi:ABC-type nitrate/sulfonate/bicarbonate transport system substrate-binding protein